MKQKKTELVEREVQQPVKAFSIIEEGASQDTFSMLLASCNDAVRINDIVYETNNMSCMPKIVQNCYNSNKVFVDPIISCSVCSSLEKIQELNTLLKEDIDKTRAAIGAENVRRAIMRYGDDFINTVSESITIQQNKMEFNTISCALAVLKEAGFEVQIDTERTVVNRYNSTLGYEFKNFWSSTKKTPTRRDYLTLQIITSNSINQATLNLYREFTYSAIYDFIMRYPGKDVNIISEVTHPVFLAFHDSLMEMAKIVDDLIDMILQDGELLKFLGGRTRYRDEYSCGDWDGQL